MANNKNLPYTTQYPSFQHLESYNDEGRPFNDPSLLSDSHRPQVSSDRVWLDTVYRDEPPMTQIIPRPQTSSDMETLLIHPDMAMKKYIVLMRVPTGLLTTGCVAQIFTRPESVAGSRLRCFGWFFCCTVLVALFLIIGVVLTLVLYVRPPAFNTGSIGVQNDTPFAVVDNGLQINLQLPIQRVSFLLYFSTGQSYTTDRINNPNYFSASLRRVDADVFYNPNATLIGNGNVSDVSIPINGGANFTFPIVVTYTSDIDPSGNVLRDILMTCFVRSDQNLHFSFNLRVRIRLFSITVSLPTIHGNQNVRCPIPESEIQNALGGLGVSPDDISRLINGLVDDLTSGQLGDIIDQLVDGLSNATSTISSFEDMAVVKL
ncbi:hypothetical protein OF83DRAFT_1169094 [Amylostereum chailletii]|nr:hypothetical protein OF83DRAFT_1169094 [Amylostereum chailletii]